MDVTRGRAHLVQHGIALGLPLPEQHQAEMSDGQGNVQVSENPRKEVGDFRAGVPWSGEAAGGGGREQERVTEAGRGMSGDGRPQWDPSPPYSPAPTPTLSWHSFGTQAPGLMPLNHFLSRTRNQGLQAGLFLLPPLPPAEEPKLSSWLLFSHAVSSHLLQL